MTCIKPIAKHSSYNLLIKFIIHQSQKNTPFRRVKDDEIAVPSQLANNSFDAKVMSLFSLVEENGRSLAAP